MVTPLPLKQLTALNIARLAEPIAYSCIFPFINPLVESLGFEKEVVGIYAGIIEGAFALAQFFTVYRWGRLSDRIGRKPIILFGLAGVGSSICLFGLVDKSFWALVTARALNGALSGNGSVIKAALGEITDRTNEAKVFPIFSLMWSFGLIIGPTLGGYLAHPNLPSFPFLSVTHPYFLPCVIAGCVTLLGFVVVWTFLDETLESKRRSNSVRITVDDEESPLIPSTSAITIAPTLTPTAPPLSAIEILKITEVRKVLQSYFWLSFLANSYDSVFVLLAYGDRELGGLGLKPQQIASIMSLGGVFSACFQVFLFPKLQLKFGTRRFYRFCMWCYPFTYLTCFILSHASKTGLIENSRVLWLGIAMLVAITRTGAIAFPLNMIALNISAPSKSVLGSINGLSQMLACGSRSFGPALIGSFYALSLKTNLPIVWVVYGSMAVYSALLARRVKGREEHDLDDAERERELNK